MKPVEVRVAKVAGSAPREVGALMVVSDDGVMGTIGGGRLEFDAIKMARDGKLGSVEVLLGPEIGQCCGGAVTLAFSVTQATSLAQLREVYVFGAGHVGQAISRVLAELPLRTVMVDQRDEWLSKASVETVHSAMPEQIVRGAPPQSCFIIATHEHALDFLIVEEALRRGDATYIGMIGSKTKRGVLTKRLHSAGIDPSPLICPIGAAGLGDKRPETIAAFVACEILLALRD